MIAPKLIIAGVEIALQTFPVSQTYELIGGATNRRKLGGAAVKQTHWQKIGISISGDGWAPPALDGVNWAVPVEISCIKPQSVHSPSNVATLPVARRADLTESVLCRAVVNGELVATPVAVAVNTATATVVAGATSYQFMYYPKLICYSDGAKEALELSEGAYAWSLDAEEV